MRTDHQDGRGRIAAELSAKRAEAGRRGGRASARRRASLDYAIERVVDLADTLTPAQRHRLARVLTTERAEA
jgi:hypothetical protein